MNIAVPLINHNLSEHNLKGDEVIAIIKARAV